MLRREKLEQEKSARDTVMFFGGGLLFLFIFFIVGIPFLINFSAFLSNLLSPPKKNHRKAEQFVQRPVLEIPYEATKSGQINLNGYGAVNSTIDLFVNNEKFSSMDNGKTGLFNFSKVKLASGSNELYVSLRNKQSDDEVKSEIKSIIFDAIPPKIELESISDNQEFVLNNQITIKGKLNEEGTLYLNGNYTMVSSDNTFTIDYSLSDGENKLEFQAIDKAENEAKKMITVRFRK